MHICSVNLACKEMGFVCFPRFLSFLRSCVSTYKIGSQRGQSLARNDWIGSQPGQSLARNDWRYSRLGKLAEVSLRLWNAKSTFELGRRILVHVIERLCLPHSSRTSANAIKRLTGNLSLLDENTLSVFITSITAILWSLDQLPLFRCKCLKLGLTVLTFSPSASSLPLESETDRKKMTGGTELNCKLVY